MMPVIDFLSPISLDGFANRLRAFRKRLARWAARANWQHRATLEAGAVDRPHCLEAVHSRIRAARVISDSLTALQAHSNRLFVAKHVRAASSAHSLYSLIELCRSLVRLTVAKLLVGWRRYAM
jgi:hypothetical protein